MKIFIFSAICVFWISATSKAETNSPVSAGTNAIVLPELIPDPLERLNRRFWVVNEVAMKGVMKPSEKLYRLLVPPPFRIGISNVGQNLQYPRRLINNILQERWAGAGTESARFLCNSVLGMGGFMNVAGDLRISVSDADFGETFGTWGWKHNIFLMIPVAGPNSDRDGVGAVADSAVNPLSYYSPYSYIPGCIRYNDLADTIDGYVRLSDSEMDPYSLVRYGFALERPQPPAKRQAGTQPDGELDLPSLESLQAALFGFRDPHFPEHGRTERVKLPDHTGELPYTMWLQPKIAPIIYILPGIGGHRSNSGSIALAELFYQKGFSAVTISSTFNYEFIANGLTADLPGYAVPDVKDVHLALTEIDRQIQREHPGKIGKRGLMGYSMGGFHTLLLAANANPSLLHFDRYLAIDTPVRLLYAIERIDSFYNSALEWPSSERTEHIEQLLIKALGLARADLSDGKTIRLSAAESRFLIALAFRLKLRDVIFFTQMRHNQGILKEPIDKWKREPAYRAIMNYSFADYLRLFIAPYYQERGIDLLNNAIERPAVDLRASENFYKTNSAIRLVSNEDDILLAPEDVHWLEETFGRHLVLFPRGGHLGNLGETPVQVAILNAFADLIEPPLRGDVISLAAKRALVR